MARKPFFVLCRESLLLLFFFFFFQMVIFRHVDHSTEVAQYHDTFGTVSHRLSELIAFVESPTWPTAVRSI